MCEGNTQKVRWISAQLMLPPPDLLVVWQTDSGHVFEGFIDKDMDIQDINIFMKGTKHSGQIRAWMGLADLLSIEIDDTVGVTGLKIQAEEREDCEVNEALKCCGNCLFFIRSRCMFKAKSHPTDARYYCDDWQFYLEEDKRKEYEIQRRTTK